MLNDLQPYPEYKDSGLPWLGNIPAHWGVIRAKYVLHEVDERSTTGKETHLSMSQKHGLIESSKIDNWRLQSESYVGGKLCKVNDLVLNRLKAHLGVIAHAPQDGVVSPDYTVFRIVRNDEARFFELLFKTHGYIAELRRSTKGIVEGFWRLYTDDFYSIRVLTPPQQEQRIILTWIDRIDERIRRFIRNKRRLIELLNEQKQAIVDRAVTRGIDSTVPFRKHKDAWVGEVPQHWEVSKIKRNALFNPSKSESGLDRTSTRSAVFLPMEKVSASGEIDCSEIRSISELWDGYTYFRRDDVVIAKITPCFENGKGAYLCDLSTDFGFGTTEFIVLRAKQAILPRFLYFLTHTKSFRLRATEFMTGAAGQKRVPVDFIKNYPVALPPVEEQKAILEHIDQEIGRLDLATARARREIDLIREYRTRLIADIVTGKVDVRLLAPEIVESVAEDFEPLDDDDNFSEQDSGAPEDFELAGESLT